MAVVIFVWACFGVVYGLFLSWRQRQGLSQVMNDKLRHKFYENIWIQVQRHNLQNIHKNAIIHVF